MDATSKDSSEDSERSDPSSEHGESNGEPPPPPVLGEPDTLPLTYCRKCEAEVKPEGKGRCPRCQTFLRLNFVARKHPVNVLRRDALLADLLVQFPPANVVQRAARGQLAAALERLETTKPGTTEWVRLSGVVKVLSDDLCPPTPTVVEKPQADLSADQLVTQCEELLEQARAIRDAERAPVKFPSTADGTYPAAGAETIVPERAEALLALLVAGGTLSERQLAQLDVLREAVRRLPPDPPEPPASDPARPTPFAESGLVLAPDTPNAGPPSEPPATLAPAPTCGFGCGSPRRCAELKATRLDAWRALHWLDPEEVARRDAEATGVMFTMLGKPSPFL